MIEVPDWAAYQSFRDDFRSVLDERYFPIHWLDRQILDGEVKFFKGEHSAIIAEIRVFPGGAKDVHGLIAAGDRKEIVDSLIPQAIEWGLSRGCIAATIESRPAWAKVLKEQGFDVHQVTIRKELGDGPQ